MHISEVGGPPQHLRPWLAALAKAGDLTIIAPGAGPVHELYGDIAETQTVDYAPLIAPRGLNETAAFVPRLLADVQRLRHKIQLVEADLAIIVTTFIPAALLAARLARVPTIVFAAEIYRQSGLPVGWMRRTALGALPRFTEWHADAIVCCSRTVAAQFCSRRTAVSTAYPGVDQATLVGDRASFRLQHGLSDADPCVAVLGNITPGRGQDIVIRALPQLRRSFPRLRCVIAGKALPRPGDLAYERSLHELAEELQVRDAVAFVGFVDRVADVYAGSDVVINPARSEESFGRVAVEALVAGRPVIAARVGAIPETLRDGTDALLVEPQSVEALVAATIRMWDDVALRDRLVAAGRAEMLRRFDEEAGVKDFLNVVRGVLRRRSRALPGKPAAPPV